MENSRRKPGFDASWLDGVIELRRRLAYGSPERQGLVWVLICLTLVVILYIGFAIAVDRERPPRTIVLILATGFFHEDFGFAGSGTAQTPTLDGLARTGALFPMTHVTMSRSRPSQLSIATGRYRPRFQSDPSTDVIQSTEPEAPLVMLPGLLARRQYLTWVGGKFAEPVRGMRSFDFGYTKPEDLVRKHDGGVKKFLKTASGRDAFLWWAPRLPQHPSSPPAEILNRIRLADIEIPDWVASDQRDGWRKRKREILAMGTWLDDGIAELFSVLKDENRLENTLVVFLSDSGSAIQLPSEGTPYEAGLRTPLIVWEAGRPIEQQPSDKLVSSVDVLPTILDWANIEIPPSMDGSSLGPLIGGTVPWRSELVGEIDFPIASRKREKSKRNEPYALYARTAQWKYVTYLRDLKNREAKRVGYQAEEKRKPFRNAGDEELYDLTNDPFERDNLARSPEHREQMESLRRTAFGEWRNRGGGKLPIRRAELDTAPSKTGKPDGDAQERPSISGKEGET